MRSPLPFLALVSLVGLLPLAAVDVDFTSPHAGYAVGAGGGTCIALGRLDGNATNDLVIGYLFGTSITIVLNPGTGSFSSWTTLPVPGSAQAVALTDLNGDGKNDVVVTNGANISVFLGMGDGTFAPRSDFATSSQLYSLSVGDVDGDGRFDVVAGGLNGIDFFKGNGAGAFAPVVRILTTGSTYSLVLGDLDGDHRPDIVCVNQLRLTTLFGNGDGTFAAPVTYRTARGDREAVALGDFNGDGQLDLAESNYGSPSYGIVVLLNIGHGAFGMPQFFPCGLGTSALLVDDVDGDGKQDLLCTNSSSSTVGILRGKGDGAFHPHVGYPTVESPYALAVGDLDGNGSRDVVTANFSTYSLSVLLQGPGTAPGAVTSIAASPVSDHLALLHWTTPSIGSYGAATPYDLRLAVGVMTPGSFATATSVLPGPTPGPIGSAAEFLLSGLAPSTTYSVAITTTDTFGRTSPLSAITTFHTGTSDSTPPAQPSLSSWAIGDHYAVLGWQAPGDDGMLGTASGYDLRSSTVPFTDGASFAAGSAVPIPPPKPGGQWEQVTVSGLLSGTTYYFALTAHDEVPLTSLRSTALQVTTTASDTSSPSAIYDLTVVSTSDTSFTVEWSAGGDDSSIGSASSYDLRWSTSLISDDASFLAATQVAGLPAPLPFGTVQSAAIDGLTPGTRYYLALRAADEVPNVGWISNVVTAMTSPAIPPPDVIPPATVNDLAVVSVGATSLTLQWTAPGDDGMFGRASSYDLRWSTNPITDLASFQAATPVAGVPAPAPGGTAESSTIAGLSSDHHYFIALRCADEVPNPSGLSVVVSAWTADTIAPATISDLAISAPTAGSVTLTWTAPGDDGTTGSASSYEVRFSTTPITDAITFAAASAVTSVAAPQIAGTVEHLILSGLTAGTTYYAAIRASDERSNASGISNVAIGSTSGGSVTPVPPTGAGKKCGFGSGIAALLLLLGFLMVARLRPR